MPFRILSFFLSFFLSFYLKKSHFMGYFADFSFSRLYFTLRHFRILYFRFYQFESKAFGGMGQLMPPPLVLCFESFVGTENENRELSRRLNLYSV